MFWKRDTFDLDREHTRDGKGHCRNLHQTNVTELNLRCICILIKEKGSHPSARCLSGSISNLALREPKGIQNYCTPPTPHSSAEAIKTTKVSVQKASCNVLGYSKELQVPLSFVSLTLDQGRQERERQFFFLLILVCLVQAKIKSIALWKNLVKKTHKSSLFIYFFHQLEQHETGYFCHSARW